MPKKNTFQPLSQKSLLSSGSIWENYVSIFVISAQIDIDGDIDA